MGMKRSDLVVLLGLRAAPESEGQPSGHRGVLPCVEISMGE